MLEFIIDRLAGVEILPFIFALTVIWTIVITIEVFRRENIIQGELARKAIHVGSGLFLAVTPLFMTRTEILLLNGLFLAGLLIFSGALHLFKSIEDVKRWSLGQFLYPVGVGIVVLLFSSRSVYSFAVLILAFSDGFAAVLGKAYGKKSFKIIGGTKTYLGSFSFFLISLTLFLLFTVLRVSISPETVALSVLGAGTVTAAEASIGGGFDNIVVPITAALFLSLF